MMVMIIMIVIDDYGDDDADEIVRNDYVDGDNKVDNLAVFEKVVLEVGLECALVCFVTLPACASWDSLRSVAIPPPSIDCTSWRAPRPQSFPGSHPVEGGGAASGRGQRGRMR